MSRIRELKKHLESVYRHGREESIEVPLPIQTLSLVSYAQEYLKAAAYLAALDEPMALPRLQLTGQAVELALKGCLASAGILPPRHHDLVSLFELVEAAGFSLNEDPLLAWLLHLNHWFSKDLATDTKYKSRYPPTTSEGVGGVVPLHANFAAIVSALCEQARLRVPHLWPPEHSFLRNSDIKW